MLRSAITPFHGSLCCDRLQISGMTPQAGYQLARKIQALSACRRVPQTCSGSFWFRMPPGRLLPTQARTLWATSISLAQGPTIGSEPCRLVRSDVFDNDE